MESIFLIGQRIAAIYKKNQVQLNILLKFLAGLFVFMRISTLGQNSLGGVKSALIIILLSVLTAIATPSVFMLLCVAACCLYIAAVSIEAAIAVFIVFFIIFVFYVRLFPKESLIIPVMLCAYFLRIPYIVPLFAVLYIGARALVPIAVAVFMHYNAYLVEGMAALTPRADFTPLGVLDSSVRIYEYISGAMAADKGWIFIAAVLVLAVIAGWVINNFFINYEREIALGVSAAVIVIGLFIAKFAGGADISAIGIILSTAVSAILMYIAAMLDYTLDYNSAERVKFQDDNYYYYVKAVPKIPLSGVKGK